MEEPFTRRDWQRMLKAKLSPLQYRYIDVEGPPEAPGFSVYIIDPATSARMARVPLVTLDAAVAVLLVGLANVREPPDPNVTILVHHPGP